MRLPARTALYMAWDALSLNIETTHSALKRDRMSNDEPMESTEEDVTRVRLPNIKENEMFGIADQLLGASKIRVMCEDGVSRVGRIPGKIKKRMWIREGDLLIISVWDFQPDKCDVRFRYTKTQAVNLSKRNKVPKNLDIF